MDIEEIIQEMNSGRDDILSYMFCLFEPYISAKDSKSNRYVRKKHIPVKREIWVPRESIYVGFIAELVSKYLTLDEEAIGLTSLVRLNDGTEQHLCLIDFRCNKSEGGLGSVRMTLRKLGISFGFLIDSGDSYHFIGAESYPLGVYMDLLRRMQNFESIGEDWPNYQISQGYADLRVTACPKRGKFLVPTLVERIGETQLKLEI